MPRNSILARMEHMPLLLVILIGLASSGCSLITIPDPQEVISKPLGTESVKVGMTKDRVLSLWGKPDEIRTVEDKEKWKGSRELWVYRAQYGAIPVDAGYLSKTKKLYFDGDNLTTITNE